MLCQWRGLLGRGRDLGAVQASPASLLAVTQKIRYGSLLQKRANILIVNINGIVLVLRRRPFHQRYRKVQPHLPEGVSKASHPSPARVIGCCRYYGMPLRSGRGGG